MLLHFETTKDQWKEREPENEPRSRLKWAAAAAAAPTLHCPLSHTGEHTGKPKQKDVATYKWAALAIYFVQWEKELKDDAEDGSKL